MTNKIKDKGFTLAEALIAMLLVAVLAAGVITALMSTKRAITMPSNKEDMVFAVETLNTYLQTATTSTGLICPLGSGSSSSFSHALDETPGCMNAIDNNNGFLAACHNVNCLLPRSCTTNTTDSYFVYNVTRGETEEDGFSVNYVIKCGGEGI